MALVKMAEVTQRGALKNQADQKVCSLKYVCATMYTQLRTDQRCESALMFLYCTALKIFSEKLEIRISNNINHVIFF